MLPVVTSGLYDWANAGAAATNRNAAAAIRVFLMSTSVCSETILRRMRAEGPASAMQKNAGGRARHAHAQAGSSAIALRDFDPGLSSAAVQRGGPSNFAIESRPLTHVGCERAKICRRGTNSFRWRTDPSRTL